MKKVLSLILAVILAISCLSFNIFAADDPTANDEIISLENGYYAVVTIEESNVSRATRTKSGTKDLSVYDNSDNLCFVVTITGIFSYTGSSATCTSASISYNIHLDNWKIKSATATKSGNKAVGNFTAKRYTLGIPVETVEQTFYLTCSATGVLS